MTSVDHPGVTRARIIVRLQMPIPGLRRVLVVETSIILDPTSPAFNDDDFQSLQRAVQQAAEKANLDGYEIESAAL
jgi:hypothetical protein